MNLKVTVSFAGTESEYQELRSAIESANGVVLTSQIQE